MIQIERYTDDVYQSKILKVLTAPLDGPKINYKYSTAKYLRRVRKKNDNNFSIQFRTIMIANL